MKPLKQCTYLGKQVDGENPFSPVEEGKKMVSYLLGIGRNFPSLLMGFSARKGARSIAWEIADYFTHIGLNVFISKGAVPISALSISLIKRNIPMGVYIDGDDSDAWHVLPLAAHGGPADPIENQNPTVFSLPFSGVIGETDLSDLYLKSIESLTDFRFHTDTLLSQFVFPFPEIQKKMLESDFWKKLFDPRQDSISATISDDGQIVGLISTTGKKIPIEEVFLTLGKYLINVRGSWGTIIGPPGTEILAQKLSIKKMIEIQEIPNDPIELSYRAGFSDLLLGWCQPGYLVHQGHSPFGDGLLTLTYLFETWDWEKSLKK
ncbi:MAG: hypothetical protein HQM08_13440 [Candidatus Riflebacteria bacterium]|nr:hypothetical protein [Candidatus Riflebacteria bacterium]